MKTINNYITEKLNSIKLSEKLNISAKYSCQPKTYDELRDILIERLAKDKDDNLNDIDVSKINDMHYLFYDLYPHNIDISEWDVSKVKDMHCMFNECVNFNSDISGWNVRNVENMQLMFFDCTKFNSDLSNWDVSNVIYMDDMFDNCTSLQNKPKWYKNH